MIYIVSGHHRSGTTMLFRALIEGTNLDYSWSPTLEATIRSREVDPTYDPNPFGYLQSPPITDWDNYEGKIVKQALYTLGQLPDRDFTIFLTKRNKQEIRESFRKAFGDYYPEQQWEFCERVVAKLRTQPRVTIIEVEFSDIQTKPVEVFTQLKDIGLVDNVEAAASIIDPNLYRNKL